MSLRTVPLAAVALLACASTLSAQAKPMYAPGVHRYHVTTVTSRSQIQGGGRAPFDFSVTTDQWIAVELAPSKGDTMHMTVTVDSVKVSSDLDAPKPDVDKLRGVKVTGSVSPQGRTYAFSPPAQASADIRNLYAGFSRFLMPLGAAPLAKGAAWADTAVEHQRRAGFDITSTEINSYRVTGDTTVGGQHAWRVERTMRVAQHGEGKEGGQPITLTGTVTSTGARFMSDQGVLLGGESTQRSELQTHMNESEGAPIDQTIKSTIELLPSR
jgi:hypothetical protein